MEEAAKKIVDLFYDGNTPSVRDMQVLSWSPETGFITVRWKQGDSCITVKCFDYGVKNQIIELR